MPLTKIFNSIVFFFLFFPLFISAQEFEDPHAYLDWQQIETQHFFVNYHPGAENSAIIIAKIAEEIYPAITKLYNHEPDTKISFIVKDYSDNSNGAAYFYDNKIEIWASSMDFDLRGTHNWLRNVITHEFTHMIQLQTSMKFGRRVPALYFQWMNYESERRPDVLYGFPNVLVSYPIPGVIIPAWFAEGIAQYNNPDLLYDFWDSHRDMILRMYTLDGNMLSWEDMGVFGKTSLGNESSYNAGFSIVQYISEKYGFDKVRDVSNKMSSLTRFTIDEAIYKVLGKSGKDLYIEWKENLKNDYEIRISKVKNNLIDGELIGKEGFGNFYPTFSPDGRKIVYTSNKNGDYFSLSSIYIYDTELKTEEMVFGPVRSDLSFSPDGQKILYSRYNEPNTKDEYYIDLFYYDLQKKKEFRLTNDQRAYSPSYSPDGKQIAFLSQKDGTVNLFTMNSDGSNIHQVTRFHSQEQIYTPKWSPDGKKVILSYSIKDGRDIAMVDSDGNNFQMLLQNNYDERNPIFSADGLSIIFSSDRAGIFNIYKYDLKNGNTDQLTNVLGGAFMPAINNNGDIAYSSYTSTGYKLSLLKNAKQINLNNSDYVKKDNYKSTVTETNRQYAGLNNYDDTKTTNYESHKYKSIFGSMSFFPFIRVDNYNKHNKGIDVIKPGVYFMTNDVLDKYGLFGGVSINLKMERDLFLIFEYKDKIPGLYDLGLTPNLSFEVYNITRKTPNQIQLTLENIPVEVTYSMLEFDFSATHKIFDSKGSLKFLYRFSRYSSDVSSFILPEINQLVPASSDVYLLGSDFGLDFNYKNIGRSKTEAINPVGRKLRLKYNYELNRFNSEGKYEIADGMLKPKYDRFNFSRIEAKYSEGILLPGWSHTLTLELHGGGILGPPVNEFFDNYIGGFSGIKGYPFYALGGNDFVRANVSYKFPISDNLDFKILHIFFSKLYLSLFADYGNSWTGGTKISDFKKDAGAEIRLETFSWYAYPTRIFFSGSYGFDSFSRKFYEFTANEKSVIYGKEWRFYLGILFGFEIFDLN